MLTMPIGNKNKGEWSEFYAFLKVLSDRKLVSADSDLSPIPSADVPVLEVFRNDDGEGEKSYILPIGTQMIELMLPGSAAPMFINSLEITSKLSTIFSKILTGGIGGFSIPEGEELATLLRASGPSAMPAGSKEDICMIVHDARTGQMPRMGYSVKSQTGGPSTLLNASQATGFIFKVKDKEGAFFSDALNGPTVASAKVVSLYSGGNSLEYFGLNNPIFKENLELVDSLLPELMATLLLQYFKTGKAKLTDVIDSLPDPILLSSLGTSMTKAKAVYKIKHFLAAVALGLTPSHEWNGNISATGGYLIVKSNGDLVCYHIFNLDKFKDYLFQNTKFEKGSETRHNYGKFYKEGNDTKIKLNLQIRFIA